MCLVNRALFALFATFAVASAFAMSAGAPEVIFVSPCECRGFHGKQRWIAKTDLSPVPLDKSTIQSVTPSQMYQWEGLGPNVELSGTTEERMPSEQKWYPLTGRVVGLKVEADGDIHLGFKTPLETQWAPLVLKFLSARRGARFGSLFLIGRFGGFRLASKQPKSSSFTRLI